MPGHRHDRPHRRSVIQTPVVEGPWRPADDGAAGIDLSNEVGSDPETARIVDRWSEDPWGQKREVVAQDPNEAAARDEAEHRKALGYVEPGDSDAQEAQDLAKALAEQDPLPPLDRF